MADGELWHVDDVFRAVVEAGHQTTKASVNSTLARGASDSDGVFERGERRGMYRVRPEIVAGWATSNGEGQAAAA